MNKTARDVIAENWNYNADEIIAELDAAGFVIVPKEPTEEMIDVGKGPSSQFVDASSSEGGPRAWELEPEQLAAIYRAMIAAASQDK